MWTRKQVKEQGVKAFKKNYWKALGVGLLLTAVVGGASCGFPGGGTSPSYYESIMEDTNDEDHFVMDVETDENGNPNVILDVVDDNGNPIEDEASSEEPVDVTLDPVESTTLFTVIAVSVFAIIGIAMVIGIAFDAFLLNPIEMGCNRFFLKNLDEKAELSNVTYAFDHGYKNIVSILFRRDLAIALWSLLFVIPGIIKSYEYRMIPYIIAEHPEMTWKEAFETSKEIMTGNKWKAFVLDLSFIGWNLLSILTLGLLSIFFVNPYKFSTNAALYETLKYGEA